MISRGNYVLFLCFLILCNTRLLGQRIEEWKSHLPYQSGTKVTQSDSKVYYGTEWSILKIDKEDFSSERISKVDGLSDVGISQIAYDKTNDQLVIAYTNSNIDIIQNDRIINLPNIKLNNDLAGDKQINDILITSNKTYLSTGFGLVEIDSESLLFGSTTFTDLAVYDAAVFDNKIFIATAEGVYFSSIDGSSNLIDFSLWQFLGDNVGLPALYESQAVASHENRLYLSVDNSLYQWDGNLMQEIWQLPSRNIFIDFLSSDGEYLMIGVKGTDGRGDVFFYVDQEFIKSSDGCNDVVFDAIQDQFGRVWYADAFRGYRTSESINNECQRLRFNSPFSHEVSDIAIKDDNVYVASGGVRDNYDYRFSRSGFYTLTDGDWNNFNEENESFIRENDLLNFLTIKPHPSREEVFIGTYWGGLVRYNEMEETYVLYDDTNSALQGTIGDSQRERVTGLDFDQDENLWITSFGAPRPLVLLSNDEQWTNFSLGANTNLIDITIDESGYLWMPAFGNSGGCYVYDPGEDKLSSGDDRVRFITSSNSSLTTNMVNTVEVDLDGAVWIGTAEGPVVFDCGSDPFDVANCLGDRIKVVQDSIVAFLLADQDILSISIDGANQKWFGSRNGIFVQSPDGETEIYRFTEANSPLFDNRVRALSYSNTGLMMIGTDRGIQSFQTPTSTGAALHRESDVLVFPNPVRPDYKGPIAVRGLVRDALVKITDINGNLVKEIRALGGQAIWDGKDAVGKDVSTGVYLIFSTDDNAFDSPDTYVTKVMIIR